MVVFLQLLVASLLARGVEGERKTLFPRPSSVIEFKPEEFNATVMDSSALWVVDYYADWCPHCQHYAPKWSEVATRLARNPRVRIAALNCAEFKQFCVTVGVQRFPTVKAYHAKDLPDSEQVTGVKVEKREVGDVLAWVRERLGETSAIRTDARGRMVELGKKNGTVGNNQSKTHLSAATAPPPRAVDVPEDHERWDPDLRLRDAEVALLFSLHQGAFLGAEAVNGATVLRGEALAELLSFLEAMVVLLPSHKAQVDLMALVDVVRGAAEYGHLREDTWSEALRTQVIDGVPPQAGRSPDGFWRTCKTYTCGLWTLFHIVSLSAAETAGARDMSAVSRGPGEFLGRRSVENILLLIRGFVAHFFGCGVCVDHFLESFDNCAFGRCELEADDDRGAVVWLWSVHNEVRTRVGSESAVWPTKAGCDACYPGTPATDGVSRKDLFARSWDSSAVYREMRQSYWRPEWTAVTRRSAVQRRGGVFLGLSGAEAALALLALVGGGGLIFQRWRGSNDARRIYKCR